VIFEVRRFPNGKLRFADGIVEMTGPESTRIPVRDVTAIEVGDPKKGRVAVKLKYNSGINHNTEKFLIEEDQLGSLQALVDAVNAEKG
jgi:hypothetical protein